MILVQFLFPIYRNGITLYIMCIQSQALVILQHMTVTSVVLIQVHAKILKSAQSPPKTIGALLL